MSLVRTRGVTLIELIVVIVVLGILAGIAALILVPAYEAYFASQRRAQLADVADAAVRRFVRDVRLALPNSARVAGTNRIEILLTRNGGRYRALNDDNGATTEQTLDLSNDDTLFDVYQPLPLAQVLAEQMIQVNDYAVIHNLGITGADAYDFTAAPTNIKRITGFSFASGALANESRVTLAAVPAARYPLESPGRRYFVVSGPVTYACVGAGTAGGNGTGTLVRWSGYTYDPNHPTMTALANAGAPPAALPPGPPAASAALLAANVSACEFTYSNSLNQLSRGLISIRLAITRANETVVLYHQAHINNVP
jgi:MSHA biogenesis protein MshO